MFAYIKGALEELENQSVVIDVQGVGYSIMVPNSIIPRLPQKGQVIKLYTYFHVREDEQVLYGFLKKEEKYFFEKLLTVSGIGPKGAMGILSVLTPHQIALAIITGDEKALCAAPGIGKKTAQRLILELKDKIDNEAIKMPEALSNLPPITSEKGEALEALMALGYSQSDAERALAGVDADIKDPSVIIKYALKNLDNRR